MTSRACSAKKPRSFYQFLIAMRQQDGELLTHNALADPLCPIFRAIAYISASTVLPRLPSPLSRLSGFPPSRPLHPVIRICRHRTGTRKKMKEM
ncbi:hypothetical protein BC826DRAFT_987908 [Russula brevipes]|nr:hypothetical protein BC826DRAFT_987908 [Russula brevipes]